MAITSSSLEEFKSFSKELNSYMNQIEHNLGEYKNQVNGIVDATLGGTQALGEAAFEGVNKALKDLSNKSYNLQEFLRHAEECKGKVTETSSQDAGNINY